MTGRIPADVIDHVRAFDIAAIASARGLKLKGQLNLAGPCPRCGGDDRFGVNVRGNFSGVVVRCERTWRDQFFAIRRQC